MIGIVAEPPARRYRKPVVVIGVDRAANVGKGSGRSQPGINLGAAIRDGLRGRSADGRRRPRMAAGLSIASRFDSQSSRAFQEERLAGEMEAVGVEKVDIDALVQPRAANRALWSEFQQLAPFGPGNPSRCSPWPACGPSG